MLSSPLCRQILLEFQFLLDFSVHSNSMVNGVLVSYESCRPCDGKRFGPASVSHVRQLVCLLICGDPLGSRYLTNPCIRALTQLSAKMTDTDSQKKGRNGRRRRRPEQSQLDALETQKETSVDLGEPEVAGEESNVECAAPASGLEIDGPFAVSLHRKLRANKKKLDRIRRAEELLASGKRPNEEQTILLASKPKLEAATVEIEAALDCIRSERSAHKEEIDRLRSELEANTPFKSMYEVEKEKRSRVEKKLDRERKDRKGEAKKAADRRTQAVDRLLHLLQASGCFSNWTVARDEDADHEEDERVQKEASAISKHAVVVEDFMKTISASHMHTEEGIDRATLLGQGRKNLERYMDGKASETMKSVEFLVSCPVFTRGTHKLASKSEKMANSLLESSAKLFDPSAKALLLGQQELETHIVPHLQQLTFTRKSVIAAGTEPEAEECKEDGKENLGPVGNVDTSENVSKNVDDVAGNEPDRLKASSAAQQQETSAATSPQQQSSPFFDSAIVGHGKISQQPHSDPKHPDALSGAGEPSAPAGPSGWPSALPSAAVDMPAAETGASEGSAVEREHHQHQHYQHHHVPVEPVSIPSDPAAMSGTGPMGPPPMPLPYPPFAGSPLNPMMHEAPMNAPAMVPHAPFQGAEPLGDHLPSHGSRPEHVARQQQSVQTASSKRRPHTTSEQPAPKQHGRGGHEFPESMPSQPVFQAGRGPENPSVDVGSMPPMPHPPSHQFHHMPVPIGPYPNANGPPLHQGNFGPSPVAPMFGVIGPHHSVPGPHAEQPVHDSHQRPQ